MRARAHIEELRGGRTRSSSPSCLTACKKGGEAGVIKKIADLVKNKVLTEIPMSDERSPTIPTRTACASTSS